MYIYIYININRTYSGPRDPGLGALRIESQEPPSISKLVPACYPATVGSLAVFSGGPRQFPWPLSFRNGIIRTWSPIPQPQGSRVLKHKVFKVSISGIGIMVLLRYLYIVGYLDL